MMLALKMRIFKHDDVGIKNDDFSLKMMNRWRNREAAPDGWAEAERGGAGVGTLCFVNVDVPTCSL